MVHKIKLSFNNHNYEYFKYFWIDIAKKKISSTSVFFDVISIVRAKVKLRGFLIQLGLHLIHNILFFYPILASTPLHGGRESPLPNFQF